MPGAAQPMAPPPPRAFDQLGVGAVAARGGGRGRRHFTRRGHGAVGAGRGGGVATAAPAAPVSRQPGPVPEAARSVARPDLSLALLGVFGATPAVYRPAPARGRRGRLARWEQAAGPMRQEYASLLGEMEALMEQGWKESTIRAAGTARRAWDAFSAEFADERPVMLYGPDTYGLSLQASLFNEISLMMFATWMVEVLRLKVDTAASYLSLTRSSLQLELGWRLTCTEHVVRLPRLMRALRSMRQVIRRKRLGWRAAHMRKLVAQLGPAETYEAAVERAVLNVAREALARCAELGPEVARQFNGDVEPTMADVSLAQAPSPHIIFMILPAKKPPGKAAKVPVPLSADVEPGVSAYHAIVAMLAMRERLGLPMEPDRPLFMLRDGSAATRGYMVDVFRRAGAALGLPAGELTGHCGRIGGSTDHFAMRTPPEVLQICGRWDSDLWQIYTRQCIGQSLEFSVAASRCDDASLEEILPDYTQPAATARLSRVFMRKLV